MRSVRVHPVDESLVPLKRRFEEWRDGKGSSHEKTPEELWAAVIELIREFGRESLSRIATTLRISHSRLTAKYEKSCTEDSVLSEDTPGEPLIHNGEAVAREQRKKPMAVSRRGSSISPLSRRKKRTLPIKITRFDFGNESSQTPIFPPSQLSPCLSPTVAMAPSLDLAGKMESRNSTGLSDLAATYHVKLSFRGLDLALHEAVSLRDISGIFTEICSRISTLVVQ